MGDINLNVIALDKTEDKKNPHERTQSKMLANFKDKILDKGFKLISNKPTRTRDSINSTPAC